MTKRTNNNVPTCRLFHYTVLCTLLATLIFLSQARSQAASPPFSTIREKLTVKTPSPSHRRHQPTAFSFPHPPDNLPFNILQISSATAAYFGLVAYFDRPRGKLSLPPSSLIVKESQVEGAGLGLFTTRSLPSGTVLGTYPGVIRAISSSTLEKLQKYPHCEIYTWRFTDNRCVIDPTDGEGLLADDCYGGSSNTLGSTFFMEKVLRWKVSTILARVNEPPLGRDCNVRTEEDLGRREVVFSTSRDVLQGEELFMDYGLTYDRSNYAKPS